MRIAQPVIEARETLHKRRGSIPVQGADWDYEKKRGLLTRSGTAMLRETRDATAGRA
jgi:hypothetical protein